MEKRCPSTEGGVRNSVVPIPGNCLESSRLLRGLAQREVDLFFDEVDERRLRTQPPLELPISSTTSCCFRCRCAKMQFVTGANMTAERNSSNHLSGTRLRELATPALAEKGYVALPSVLTPEESHH